MAITIHSDGGARGNPGPAAAAFIIKDSSGKIIASRGVYLGKTTNNQAEYLSVVNALAWFSANFGRLDPTPQTVIYYLDSELVVKQLRGGYKIKSPGLVKLASQVKNLESKIDCQINYQHVSRIKNKPADHLVNQILDRVASK